MTELESKVIELAKLSEWAASEIKLLRAQIAEGRELLKVLRIDFPINAEYQARIDAYLAKTTPAQTD